MLNLSKYFAERILDVYKIAIKNKPKHKIPLLDKVQKIIKNESSDIVEEDNSTKS